MKNIYIVLSVALILLSSATAASSLRFEKSKRFKIAQFTDTHLCLGSEEGRNQAVKTINRLCQVIDAERPNLVVFTGDIVTDSPSTEAWRYLLTAVSERKVPFVVVMGNHDEEQDATKAVMAKVITSFEGNLNTCTKDGKLADMAIPILSSTSESVESILYFFDSNDYSTIKGVEGYGWLTPDQIDWYRSTQKSVNAKKTPALAFMHIPFVEHETAWLNCSNSRIGRCAERACPGAINTGMFAAMVLCGDVMGVFVGHDHDNDFVVAHHGIALGYGRYSGDNTTYNNLRSGVRIISLEESERRFETWIHESDGRIVDKASFLEGKITNIDK